MKFFQKIRSKKALENANTTKETLEKKADEIRKDIVNDNSRANRKALNRTEQAIYRAEKRIEHIEVAIGYQSEKHAVKVGDNKKEGVHMKKAYRKAKEFNKNSIVKPGVARCIWKDAKESAFWMSKLLEEQENAQRKLDLAKPVINVITKQQAEKEAAETNRHANFMAWYNGLAKFRYFNSKDLAVEIARRTVENGKLSATMGHPAMEAASVFCKGLMAAENLLHKNAGELGGKNILTGINERRSIIDDIDAQIDDLNKMYELNVSELDELHEKVKECIKFEAWSDMDALKERFEQDKEINRNLNAKRRELHNQKNLLKAEIKVLRSGLRELQDNAVGTEKALIEAQIAAAKANRKNRKERKAGRPIFLCDKPMLKGYKMMHFTADAWKKAFAKQLNPVENAVLKCIKVEQDDLATDSEIDKAEKAIIKAVNKAIEDLNVAKESGKRLTLDAQNAKVHNARQSQLADIVGVPYGKTTDMIITISHDVANIFSKSIAGYIDEAMLDKLKVAMVEIATANGCELTTLPNASGKTRSINYAFWNANNSQLKVGKFVALSEDAYKKAAEVGRCGMTEEEFEEVNTNGPDMLKYWSYATTPGAPLMYEGKPLTVNDVLVVKSIDTLRKFKNVLAYAEDGSKELKDKAEIGRTAFDGEMFFLVHIPSQQLRGGFCDKGFGVCCAYEDGTTIIDEIAKREGWKIPEMIEDFDGVMRNWRNYKVICTKDAWKWAGWKIGESKKQFTYAEYLQRMNKLAEKYPTANMLYTARIADATEESRRKLTRQSIQMFLPATADQIARLYARSINKINKLGTHEGVLRMMAGLDKPEEERTAFEHLVEVYPELLDHPLMKRAVEDAFNRKVAEAAVRPEVDGIYPYIAEDPVAFFKIVFWKKDPNTIGLGYLSASQVNIPNEEEGTPLYIVRYPNNYICGMTRLNHNDDIYRCVGNVMILSLDGGTLIRADGDTDGDEMCVIKDKVVIELMQNVLRELTPPVVDFPHDKMKTSIVRGRKERAHLLAKAVVTANKYGPEVGKNSNLATKLFNRASKLYCEWKQTGKNRWKIKAELDKAIVAHIAAIIAIDLAKTGSMPKWLEGELEDIRKFAGKKMPWNQRFCKDNKKTPWFSEYWDDETLPESDSVVDRGARYVIDSTNAAQYKAPTGNEFELLDMLGSKCGLITNGTSARLVRKELQKLEARNYRTKNTNSEGDDEFKLIETLKSSDNEAYVSPAEFVRFLWRNQASLVYVLQRKDGDKLDNAMMQNQYYDFCHELLSKFGTYCPKDKRFLAMTPEAIQMSNVWKFVSMAFAEGNGIGNKAVSSEEVLSKKASFCMFVVKVFAYDLYQNVCEMRGIQNRWIKPEQSAAEDNGDCSYAEGEEYCNIGYCDYYDEVA